ncbi:hypothetical protein DACRYDRAFT_108294 [Dacryopinax primogenitus]|uniref:Replication protein A OB domain-containing protein n=1 Tax=Dacryopinax primogenitus (strain DJM 731) TaxID=1858805 RepID=M5FYK5_DACPD|nr:uncharacterized protein DACRYDRAFT_108294 [Dacryopinax primogenitus]EJU00955.1 hypothetical protein DACRYDRAFT_108294 [Dacryopinax primogenitus]
MLKPGPPICITIRDLGVIIGREYFIYGRITWILELDSHGYPGKPMHYLCRFTIHDESAEVNVVAWEGAALAAGMLEVGELYSFEHFGLQEANMQFTWLNNWWQVQLTPNHVQVHKINDNSTIPKNHHVDVVAVILCLGKPIKRTSTIIEEDWTKTKIKVNHVHVYLTDHSGEAVHLAAFDNYMDAFLVLGKSTVPEVIKVCRFVHMLKAQDHTYPACLDINCNKKAQTAEMDREMEDTKKDKHWVTAFNGTSECLFGMPAADMAKLRQDDNEAYQPKLALIGCQLYTVTLQIQSLSYAFDDWVAIDFVYWGN